MKLRTNRKTERAAINATRTFFESRNYVFQEVDLGNDYGKDVYVDVTDGQSVTGLCIALQVKGGASYRRASGYGIPLDIAHAKIWSHSSLPIAGIVFDPEDGNLRWCNISEFLQSHADILPSHIPVDSEQILTPVTLESEFKKSFLAFHTQRVIGPSLLQLTSRNQIEQNAALQDCFILARAEPRVLILIRHLLHIFTGDQLRLAVKILAHATPHPDIWFHSGNWIPQSTRDELRKELNWSQQEIEILLRSAERDEWHRGGQGQCVYSLLCEDRKIEAKMGDFAITTLAKDDENLTFWAMYLVIYWAGREGPEMYNGFLAIDRRFDELPHCRELRLVLKEHGALTLFE